MKMLAFGSELVRKLINAEVEVGHRPRTWRIQSINGVVPVHFCHGGFEIPQTESALVRVRNAIDVVVD